LSFRPQFGVLEGVEPCAGKDRVYSGGTLADMLISSCNACTIKSTSLLWLMKVERPVEQLYTSLPIPAAAPAKSED